MLCWGGPQELTALLSLTERSTPGEALEAQGGGAASEAHIAGRWQRRLPSDSLLLLRFWNILNWGGRSLGNGGQNQINPLGMLGRGKEIPRKEGSEGRFLVEASFKCHLFWCVLPQHPSRAKCLSVIPLRHPPQYSQFACLFQLININASFFIKHLLWARNSSKWSKMWFLLILITIL